MSDSHKSRSRKRQRSRSPSASEPRRRHKSRSNNIGNNKGNIDIEQDKLSRIFQSVESMQNKFTALSERMTAMESQFCQREKTNLHTVGETSMDDRLSTTVGPPLDENGCLGDAETSSANGLHETPLH